MEELLEDVKNFLDITWEMELGEKKKLSGSLNVEKHT